MTYDIPYAPPPPISKFGGHVQMTDTLLAFQAFSRPQVAARIAPDPLGPVNKIVSLVVGERVIKSVLWHVPAGARIELVHESIKPANGWYIEIDGRVVLYATEAEVARPITITIGREPWRARARRYGRVAKLVTCRRARALTDRVAKPLGYHREDECRGWDE